MSSPRLSAARQLTALRRSNERLSCFLDLPAERLAERLADQSGWSLQEHAFHIVLANDLSVRNVHSLLARKGRLIRPKENISEEARDVLRSGRIPRGTAQAPRFVTPPANIDLNLVREIFESTRTSLDALAERTDELDATPDCIPHQILGGLSATEWLRFARLHTAHHLLIMRELDAALAVG